MNHETIIIHISLVIACKVNIGLARLVVDFVFLLIVVGAICWCVGISFVAKSSGS
jgi:hypothetical protein